MLMRVGIVGRSSKTDPGGNALRIVCSKEPLGMGLNSSVDGFHNTTFCSSLYWI